MNRDSSNLRDCAYQVKPVRIQMVPQVNHHIALRVVWRNKGDDVADIVGNTEKRSDIWVGQSVPDGNYLQKTLENSCTSSSGPFEDKNQSTLTCLIVFRKVSF